jgi:predicted aspartyl protease
LYRLESIMLDRIEVNNVSVIILPNENLKGPMAGLLGMNVLRAFELRFDPEEQRMTLLER